MCLMVENNEKRVLDIMNKGVKWLYNTFLEIKK